MSSPDFQLDGLGPGVLSEEDPLDFSEDFKLEPDDLGHVVVDLSGRCVGLFGECVDHDFDDE